MPIRKHTPPDPYREAAEAILKAIEEEFPGIRPKRHKSDTIKALVGVMKHFIDKAKARP